MTSACNTATKDPLEALPFQPSCFTHVFLNTKQSRKIAVKCAFLVRVCVCARARAHACVSVSLASNPQ
jgi:hypothetical protein